MGDDWRFPRPADQAAQRSLVLQLRDIAARTPEALPGLRDFYLRAYSQNGEDGALLYIFALTGVETKRAVEICAGDGIECNSANLIINHGWDGLLVDGDAENVERGRRFYARLPDTVVHQPLVQQAWVTAENVNDLVQDAGFAGPIDLLSLDLDGIDYWVWNALEAVQPRVVVAEYADILGPDLAVTVPYDPHWRTNHEAHGSNNYQSASLLAFVKLARRKGYRLVGVERLGFNAFFVRDGVAEDVLPEIDHRSCFTHRKVVEGIRDRFPLVRDLDWVAV
jgi:hypothetical protein